MPKNRCQSVGPRHEQLDAIGGSATRVTYRIILSPSARRALTDELPEAVAAACFAFIRGPLADNPHRVGKALGGHLTGRHSARRGEFRVIYRINEGRVVVDVIASRHRRAYRA